MKKGKNYLVRALLLAVIATTALFILRPARDQIRLEFQSKQTLLVLQEALQKFHVEEEIYPEKTPLTGAQLIQLLMDGKHLAAPPLNPITLRPYALDSGDSNRSHHTEEDDPIIYTTDELAETYSLKVLKPASEDTLFIVDSTEHHSLE